LLKKTLPDLSAIEHTGEVRHRDVSDQPLTPEQWEANYGSGVAPSTGTTESTH
jgi:hypothetical protein